MSTDDARIHCAPGRLTRRTLLKAGLAGGLLAAGAGIASGTGRAAQAGPRTRPIPSSGERLPVVGLGTYRTFDLSAGEPRAPLREVLRRFVRLGGRVIDSSPMYGTAEAVIGEMTGALGIRDRLFFATKVWTRGREDGIEQMRRSMRRLGVQRMDLMQVHNLVDVHTHLRTLREWKDEGLVRYIGITHYRVDAHDELMRLIRSENPDFVQFNYSVLTPDAERRLLPLAADTGTAVLVNEPFETGALFRITEGVPLPDWATEFDCETWAQFALKFIVSHPAVTCTIPATSDPEHLVDNMQAAYGALPDPATRRRMVEYIRSL